MTKILKKILWISGAIILILIVVLMLSIGQIIKVGVNNLGPKLMGVPVHLEKVVVNPLSGAVRIQGLVIGNPAGFHTPSAMELNDFKLNIQMSSLFSEAIVIEEIRIEAPQITYEKSLQSSNLKMLQAHLTSAKTESPVPAETSEEKKGAGKKVIINDFLLTGARVHVTISALGGKRMTVPLPDIHMKNIGNESKGASLAEVISEVFNSISKAVVNAAASAGDIAGDTFKSVGGEAKDASEGAVNAAKGAADTVKKGVGGLFGK